MKLGPVIARVKAQAATLASRVFGAADWDALAEDGQSTLALPFAVVVPVGDEPAEDQTVGGVTQLVVETIGVIVAVANADDRGQDASDDLDDIRAELLAALLGWEPAADHSGFAYAGSEVVELTRAFAVRRFDFICEHVIQS